MKEEDDEQEYMSHEEALKLLDEQIMAGFRQQEIHYMREGIKEVAKGNTEIDLDEDKRKIDALTEKVNAYSKGKQDK